MEKGCCFYYFKNKKDLYEYLIEYSLEFFFTKYLYLVDLEEVDFIKRLKGAAQIKMIAKLENEHIFDFMETMLLSKELELPLHLEMRFEQLRQQGYALMYEEIGKSLVRNDLDIEKIFNLIRWGIDGYQQDLLHKLHDQKMSKLNFEPYWDEFYDYLDTLQKSFYISKERDS